MKNYIKAIPEMTSSVYDNKRRGAPKAGCDCVQCFGYCLIDSDAAYRESMERGRASVVSRTIPLNFAE